MPHFFEVGLTIRTGHGFKTDIDKLVTHVRAKYSLPHSERFPAARLADDLNIAICSPHDIDGIPSVALAELIDTGKKRWSAILIKDLNNDRHLIINNPTQSEHRQESNIFHEISHDLCQHEAESIELIAGFHLRRFSEDKEKQAETLGFALLIPRECLFWAAKRGMSRLEIGDHFCASQDAVRHRINATAVEKILKRKVL